MSPSAGRPRRVLSRRDPLVRGEGRPRPHGVQSGLADRNELLVHGLGGHLSLRGHRCIRVMDGDERPQRPAHGECDPDRGAGLGRVGPVRCAVHSFWDPAGRHGDRQLRCSRPGCDGHLHRAVGLGTFADGSPAATSTTDLSGEADAPTFTANGAAGTYTVTATVPGIPGSAAFSLANRAGAPAAPIGNGAAVTTRRPRPTLTGRSRPARSRSPVRPPRGRPRPPPTSAPSPFSCRTPQGANVPAAVLTTVFLSSNSTGTAVFAATRRGPALTSVTIPPGSSSVSFFYGDTEAGTPTVTATVAGLTPATQIQVVTAAAAQVPVLPTLPSSPNAG